MSRYECLDIQEQKNVKLVNPKKIVLKKKTQDNPSEVFFKLSSSVNRKEMLENNCF